MIGPRTYNATGQYVLTNVSENAAAALMIQSRLASGTGVTWGVRKRLTGSGSQNLNPVADDDAPRCVLTNALTNEAVAATTAITATTAPQMHSVICDGSDVILDVLSITGNGVLQLEMAPITGGT